MNKKYIVIFIALIVGAIALLGGNLILKQQNKPITTVQTTKQQTNDNSQQGGPDLPGQPAAPEGGAPQAGSGN